MAGGGGMGFSTSTSDSGPSAFTQGLLPQIWQQYLGAGKPIDYNTALIAGGTPYQFGQANQLPGITPGGVWSQDEINQQAHVYKDAFARQIGGDIDNATGLKARTAGAGFSVISPGETANEIAKRGMSYMGAINNDTTYRTGAAQANRQMQLQAEQAALGGAEQQNVENLAFKQAQDQSNRAGQQLALGKYQTDVQAQNAWRNALLQGLFQPQSHSQSQSTNWQAPQTGGGSPAGPYKDWGQDTLNTTVAPSRGYQSLFSLENPDQMGPGGFQSF